MCCKKILLRITLIVIALYNPLFPEPFTTVFAQEEEAQETKETETKKKFTRTRPEGMKIGVAFPNSIRYIHNVGFISGKGSDFFWEFISENWITSFNLGLDYYKLDSNTQNIMSDEAMNITIGVYKILYSDVRHPNVGRFMYIGFEGGGRFEVGDPSTFSDSNSNSTSLCYFVAGASLQIWKFSMDFKLKSSIFENRELLSLYRY